MGDQAVRVNICGVRRPEDALLAAGGWLCLRQLQSLNGAGGGADLNTSEELCIDAVQARSIATNRAGGSNGNQIV